jgi:hypothetical protein
VAGALPAEVLERWGDLTDVVDGEIARYEAREVGFDVRRRGTRAPLRLPVRFRSTDVIGMGQTIDLSCAGCAVEAPCPLPPGTQVAISVRLPRGLGTLNPVGEVKWAALDAASQAWQAGVGFAPLADWEREALASCVLGAVAPFLVAAE